MPRPWTLEITDFPELTENRRYAMKITAVEKNRKPRGVHVTLEHTTDEQLGRTSSICLPLPIRPAGTAAQLLVAAGIEIAAGNTISPKDAEGETILVCFRRDPGTGDLQPATFEPASKHNRNSKTTGDDDGAGTNNSFSYGKEAVDGQPTLAS